jgi:hypothetical protein
VLNTVAAARPEDRRRVLTLADQQLGGALTRARQALPLYRLGRQAHGLPGVGAAMDYAGVDPDAQALDTLRQHVPGATAEQLQRLLPLLQDESAVQGAPAAAPALG